MRPVSCLMGAFAGRAGDTTAEITLKATWLVAHVAALVLNGLAIGAAGAGGENIAVLWVCGVAVLLHVVCTAVLGATKRLSTVFVCGSTALFVGNCVGYDLVRMAVGGRGWAYLVVPLALVAMSASPPWLHVSTATAACGWAMVAEIELAYRIGVLDLGGLPPQNRRAATVCGCTALPCGSESVLGAWSDGVGVLMVLGFTYRVVRTWAGAVRHEQRRTDAIVDASKQLARSLAFYDLDTAKMVMVHSKDDLPADLSTYFEVLIANLNLYRPYLPHSVVGAVERASDAAAMSPNVALLKPDFTPLSVVPSASILSSSYNTPAQRALSCSNIFSYCGASPPASPISMNAIPQQLKEQCVSLLVATVHIPLLYPLTYVARHAQLLTSAIESVESHRGSLDFFEGDKIFASFNAFRPCLNHSRHALATAISMTVSCEKAESWTSLTCAVARGNVCAGTLGTETLLRPTVVGKLPGKLVKVGYAAELLSTSVLATQEVFRNVSVEFPLHVLLHRVLLEADDNGFICEESATVLYSIDFTQEEGTVISGDGEWMYAMEREAGTRWDAYNDAGLIYHEQGAAAAVAQLEASQTSAEMMTAFREAVDGARTLVLMPTIVNAALNLAEMSVRSSRGGVQRDARLVSAGDVVIPEKAGTDV